MCATRSNLSSNLLRIEPVDNWHDGWSEVLKLVTENDAAKKLRIDKDGWLSARQVLMVAFVGKTPSAYLCFAVSPSKDGCSEAKHISHGVGDGFCGRGIESQLYQAAIERARALGCEKLRGFRLTSKWC